MQARKSRENTRTLTLFEIKNATRILSKTQEQWLFFTNGRQKKKKMNQMHKINEIFAKKKENKSTKKTLNTATS